MYVQLQQFANLHCVRVHAASRAALVHKSRLERCAVKPRFARVMPVNASVEKQVKSKAQGEVETDFVVLPCNETGIAQDTPVWCAEDDDFEMI